MLRVELSGNKALVKIIAFNKEDFCNDLERLKNDIPATYRMYDDTLKAFVVRDIDQLQHIPYIQAATTDRKMQLSFGF